MANKSTQIQRQRDSSCMTTRTGSKSLAVNDDTNWNLYSSSQLPEIDNWFPEKSCSYMTHTLSLCKTANCHTSNSYIHCKLSQQKHFNLLAKKCYLWLSLTQPAGEHNLDNLNSDNAGALTFSSWVNLWPNDIWHAVGKYIYCRSPKFNTFRYPRYACSHLPVN
jgi:hypothetical protein